MDRSRTFPSIGEALQAFKTEGAEWIRVPDWCQNEALFAYRRSRSHPGVLAESVCLFDQSNGTLWNGGEYYHCSAWEWAPTEDESYVPIDRAIELGEKLLVQRETNDALPKLELQRTA